MRYPSRAPELTGHRPWLLLPLVLLLTLLAPPLSGPASATEPARVLFVGNSYTYFNDLPQLVARIAAALPDAAPLAVDMAAPGGYTLERHWQDPGTRSRLDAGGWSAVVLQEQSRRPFVEPELMRRFTARLHGRIADGGARTVLFLTWPRRHQPERLADLTATYRAAAKELGAEVSPVGLAWRRVREQHPDLQLYQDDGSHPSPAGSYLAACVLAGTLTGKDPQAALGTEPAGITAEDGARLRKAASEVLAEEATEERRRAVGD